MGFVSGHPKGMLPAAWLCVLYDLKGSGRRLQQIVDIPPEKFADLVVSVAYPGTTEGGKNVVGACSTGACTQNVTGVRYVAGEVVAGTKDDLKVPGTTLVQQRTLPGETYKFVATYQVDGAPAAALLTLTTSPLRVVACKATEQGKGVTAFECYPLEARSNVVFTANGPDPAVATNRIQASMSVPNISECCSKSKRAVCWLSVSVQATVFGVTACTAAWPPVRRVSSDSGNLSGCLLLSCCVQRVSRDLCQRMEQPSASPVQQVRGICTAAAFDDMHRARGSLPRICSRVVCWVGGPWPLSQNSCMRVPASPTRARPLLSIHTQGHMRLCWPLSAHREKSASACACTSTCVHAMTSCRLVDTTCCSSINAVL